MNRIRGRLAYIPIRTRLTLWFVSIMGATLIILSVYLSIRFLNSLSNSINTGLKIVTAQTLSNVDLENGKLAFGDTEVLRGSQVSFTGFAMHLVDISGNVVEQRGDPGEQPAWGPLISGYHTSSRPGDDTQWRTLTEPVRGVDGSVIGWLQVVQALGILTDTQQDLRDQLILIIPILILILGAGGYFLAYRALRPIDEITHTAGTISASDLSKRIDFEGPRDEVGRLADTFDAMLGRLQSAFERERRFSADAAHELRTPLSVLRGKLDVTLSRDRSPRVYRETLQDLRSQVKRLIVLSNDLLMLSRLEQRKMEGTPSTLNLTDIIDSVLEQFQLLADKKRINITHQLPSNMAMKGYSDPLLRLFLNLFDNAVKYTHDGGDIRLRGSVQSDTISVELFNSAQELTEDQAQHLFERFYRVDPSRARNSGGAGLGLSIAQEIVHAHGGEISVKSQQGQGITFRVELPMRLPR